MSSNLPPGVTESMLPGNRPEDAQYELWKEAQVDLGFSIVGNHEQFRALHAVIEFVMADCELGEVLTEQLEAVQVTLEERLADEGNDQ